MKILELVENCTRIGISGHENPDGDCAGSCCGLALYLRKVMPQAAVDIYLESMPDALVRNIPGADTIIYDVTGSEEDYDAFIILDSEPSRTGKAERRFDRAKMAADKMREGGHCIVLLNKTDLHTYTKKETIIDVFTNIFKGDQTELPTILPCSLLTGEGMELLSDEISTLFHTGSIEHKNEVFLSSSRHKEAVREAEKSISLVLDSIHAGMSEEFYAIDLMNAYDSLGKILGEAVEDDLVEEIFSKFCMGK